MRREAHSLTRSVIQKRAVNDLKLLIGVMTMAKKTTPKPKEAAPKAKKAKDVVSQPEPGSKKKKSKSKPSKGSDLPGGAFGGKKKKGISTKEFAQGYRVL